MAHLHVSQSYDSAGSRRKGSSLGIGSPTAADSGYRKGLCFLSKIEQKSPHHTFTLLCEFAKRIRS